MGNYFIDLAKAAIEKFIKEGTRIAVPDGVPARMLASRAGVFVTIRKAGELRGCIGSFLPVQKNLAEEIIRNAILAATQDYRFGPVRVDELPDLAYEVSMLSSPRALSDKKAHDPKKHGLIISDRRGRRGLLLPDIEGVETLEDQIDICCRKGGIDPAAAGLVFEEFTVEKHE